MLSILIYLKMWFNMSKIDFQCCNMLIWGSIQTVLCIFVPRTSSFCLTIYPPLNPFNHFVAAVLRKRRFNQIWKYCHHLFTLKSITFIVYWTYCRLTRLNLTRFFFYREGLTGICKDREWSFLRMCNAKEEQMRDRQIQTNSESSVSVMAFGVRHTWDTQEL